MFWRRRLSPPNANALTGDLSDTARQLPRDQQARQDNSADKCSVHRKSTDGKRRGGDEFL
jgi:hypothetical protein